MGWPEYMKIWEDLKMKKINLIVVVLCIITLCGCPAIVKEAQKIDANMASYIGVEKLSPDCKAGLAQLDADISDDPVSMKAIKAVTANADTKSEDYKKCYNAYAWLNYVGKKTEGAVKTWIKKLTELGVLAQ